jgi:hypothetical protein
VSGPTKPEVAVSTRAVGMISDETHATRLDLAFWSGDAPRRLCPT